MERGKASWLWFIETRGNACGTAATAEPSSYAGSWLDIVQEFQLLFSGPSMQNHARLHFRPDYYVYCLGYLKPELPPLG